MTINIQPCEICGNKIKRKDSLIQKAYICSSSCKIERKKLLPKKISITSEIYWIKKGHSTEEAKQIVSDLQKKRSKRCVEYWINKGMTIDEASAKVSDIQTNIAKQNTHTREERRSYSHRCVEFWITQGLSLEEARKKVSIVNDNVSLDAYVNRLGEEEGKKAHEKLCNQRKIEYTLEHYINKHGLEKGTELWLRKFENRSADSKVSKKLFMEILERLPEEIKSMNIYFKGLTDKEFGFHDADKYYFYDFVISNINYCLEFNGAFWHGDPEKYKSGDYVNMRGGKILVDEIWQRDNQKLKAIENKGYKVKVLWYRNRKDYATMVNECLQDIIAHYKKEKDKNE